MMNVFTRGSRPSLLLLLIGAALGSVFASQFDGDGWPGRGPQFPPSLFAQDGDEVMEHSDGEYQFFTFRRNLWAIHKASGKVQFLMFPDGLDQKLERSAIHQVDQDVFPPGEVTYQLSERNLTNFLWILNPLTGKARYIRAARNGGFEISDIESVGHLGQ